jgi:23S rRNA pseudouridine955/2504/2580 synthase
LLETPDLLFLDKPAGLLVHDGDNSLEAMVRRYLSGKLDASQSFVPGPLHRLDRNTSGVIAFSRSISGARVFSEALRQGLASKTYIALLEGQAGEPELWNDLVVRDGTTRKSRVEGREKLREPTAGAKEAIAEMIPLLANDHASLAVIRLLTGRTHQIRTQAAAHGHPLLGDAKYGSPSKELSYYLHAWKLSFRTRLFNELPPEIIAPLPRNFIEKTQSIFSIDEKGVYSKLRHF